jgi:uncharacterized SAM-binding protein YcdF (DUF218 family)
MFNVAWLATMVSSLHTGYFLQVLISIGAIVLGIFYKKIPKLLHFTAWSICTIIIIFTVSLAIFGSTSNVDYTEDVVIVLGAGLRSDYSVSSPLYWRLQVAIEYFRENPNAMIIVCGGLGAGRTVTEAEAMARHLTERGIPEESIILEDRSTTTVENLAFAKEILDGYFPEGFRAVLISNDFHMYRAVRLAQIEGIYVNHRGAFTPQFTIPVNYLRESAAVIHMWIFD